MFKNLNIAHRLAGAFGVVALLVAGSYVVIYTQLDRYNAAAAQIDALEALNTSVNAVAQAMFVERRALLSFIATGRGASLDAHEAARAAYDAARAEVQMRLADFPALAADAGRIQDLIETWRRDVADRQVRLMRNALTVNAARAIEYAGASARNFAETKTTLDSLRAAAAEIVRARRAEQQAASNGVNFAVLVGAALSLIGAASFCYVLVLAISRPIERVTAAMDQMARGDLDITLQAGSGGSEIDVMTRALGGFRDALAEKGRNEAEQAAAERAHRQDVADRLNALAKAFDASMRDSIGHVVDATRTIEASIEGAGQADVQSGDSALKLADTAREMVDMAQTVVASSTELSASNDEISERVSRTAAIADRADADVAGVDAQIRRLAGAVSEIGDVVGLITVIAEQTNLLALNATIEAARAGDAGRGFSVVASEVKSLANQTAEATNTVGEKIAAIQSETDRAVAQVAEIASVIVELSTIARDVAGAIEQQARAAAEISENMNRVNADVGAVSDTSRVVSKNAIEAAAARISTIWTVDDLAAHLDALGAAADDFTREIRSRADDSA